ncbi:MAG TPA: hypothetical protein PKH03_06750 [Syntrophales bacterium]|nr:hypothetical protein [Syntrophales bacterium]
MKRPLIILLSVGLVLWMAAMARAEVSSVTKIGNDVIVSEGVTVKNATAIGGQVTVDGTVQGDAVAIGGSVVLGSGAVVAGDCISIGGVIVKGRGADVRGDLIEINSTQLTTAVSTVLTEDWEGWSWVFAILSICIFFMILVIALITVTLMPKPFETIATAIRHHTFRAFLWGLLATIIVVPLAVLLTVSVIGIVLIPLEIIVVVCGVLMGFIALARLVGRGVFLRLRKREPGLLRATFWGLLLLWILGWLPYIGPIIKVLAVVVGLGGVIMTRFGTYPLDSGIR